MKIYTRRGDSGETDLIGSGRVAKDHPRVEAYGAVDELNAALGLCAAATTQADLRALVEDLQRSLFALGAYLATPEPRHRGAAGATAPEPGAIERLERHIDRLEAELEPLRRFILPGGSPAAAAFHQARAVCRRAERCAVGLARDSELDPVALQLLNRLSDLLFVLARVENRRAGRPDVEWAGRTAPS